MSTDPPPKRRTWIGKWIRDETFWRETTSQVLAGLIVLAFGAVVAAASGLIDWSIVWLIGRVVLGFAIFLAVLIVPAWIVGASVNRRMRGRNRERIDRFWAVGFVVCITEIGALVVDAAVINPLFDFLLHP
jgi:small-conductance mechanosensitive channel